MNRVTENDPMSNTIAPPPSLSAASQFDRDGYYVARALLSADEVSTIRDAFMAQAAGGPVPGLSETLRNNQAYQTDDPLAKYPRMLHPHRHLNLPVGQLAMKYMTDPRIYGLLKPFFGEEPLAVQSMFYFKPPGARGQDLHQDNFFLRVRPGTCCAAWIAIDDADPGNGGMNVVPGSSGLDIACPEEADTTKSFTKLRVPVPSGLEEVPVWLKAGDVLFFNGSVIHGSGPNRSTDRFRRSLICHYVPQSTAEIASFYKVYRFDGVEVPVAESTDGGPCGTFTPMAAH
jgi:phytanoyl-CoA hydroxylase